MSHAHEKSPVDDVFDPVTPLGDDAPLTPEEEARLLAMDGFGPGPDDTWAPIGVALRDGFEDAAERAKPDLAGVSARVFARLDAERPKAHENTGLFAGLLALLARLQPHLALAAATAAIVLVVLPLAKDAPDAADPVAGGPVPAPVEPLAAVVELDLPTSVELRRIAFDNSDGLVFHDPGTDSTVIWVNEYDGA